MIYADVLIALNLYVSWFLLLASDHLSGRRCKAWRRGLAALAGGVSSLAIFLPELPFGVLCLFKLALAGCLTWIAGGRRGFCRRTAYFFGANFLFAGVMIALWVMAAPPRLVIRNGFIYYHIPAMTLALSTILAYGVARLLVWLRRRGAGGGQSMLVRAGLGGREILLEVFHDSGNRLHGIGGTPVVVCDRAALAGLFPAEVLGWMQNPGEGGLPKYGRVQLVPCATVNGSGMLGAAAPDFFRAEGGGAVRCLLAAAKEPIRGGFQAVAGDEIFEQLAHGRKEEDHAGHMEKLGSTEMARPVGQAAPPAALRLHKRAADTPAAPAPGGGAESAAAAPDRTG